MLPEVFVSEGNYLKLSVAAYTTSRQLYSHYRLSSVLIGGPLMCVCVVGVVHIQGPDHGVPGVSIRQL